MLYEEYGYLSEEEYTEELSGIMQYGVSIGEKAWDEGYAVAWREAEEAFDGKISEARVEEEKNAKRDIARSMRDDGDSIEHIAHIFHTSEEDIRKLLNE